MTDHRLFSRLTPLLQDLSPEHRSVTYDMRGFGKSDNPTDSLYSRFEDLEAVLGASSLPIDLVGVGFGGPIALEYAIAHSANVRSVCCIGSGLPGHRWSPNAMLDITEAKISARRQTLMRKRESWDAAPMEELVQWKQTFISGNDTWGHLLRRGDREAARILMEMARDYRGFHFFMEECVEPNPFGDVPLLKRLDEVEKPVQVLVGEMDTRDFHSIAREIWRGVPRAWGEGPVVVPDCGHFAVVEQARPVAERIVEFWGTLEAKESLVDGLDEPHREVKEVRSVVTDD